LAFFPSRQVQNSRHQSSEVDLLESLETMVLVDFAAHVCGTLLVLVPVLLLLLLQVVEAMQIAEVLLLLLLLPIRL